MKLFVFVALMLHGQYAVGDVSLTKLSSANNAFATLLYKTLRKVNSNLVCSPLSLSVVLTMLLEGSPSTSTTFKEIQTALQYSNLTLTEIESGYKQLLSSLQSGKNYTLSLADSVWIKENFKVADAYIQKTKDIFKTDTETFTAENGKTLINKWAAEHTMNKITNLLNNLDPSAVMVLVNAIYFQASWDQPFDKGSDENGTFVYTDMAFLITFMRQTSSFPYADSDTLKSQILMLDYVGKEVSLVVILPKQVTDLFQLEKDLTSRAIEDAIKSTKATGVEVILPKFSITSSLPLNDLLMDIGIKKAFSDQADFSQIANGLQVSEVVQKAVIEVTETGTVAAAASAVVLTESAILTQVTFKADHPFLYLLYHKPTASILFIGQYISPELYK